MKAERIDVNAVKPGIYNPLIDLNNQLKKSSLTLSEMMMIYVRASQINGCAFCVQSHTKEAIENGEKQYRIHALPYWRESPFFTKEEQLILQMTEEITAISQGGLSNALFEEAMQVFGQEKVSDIIMAVSCINAWNRIGRATLLVPEPSQN